MGMMIDISLRGEATDVAQAAALVARLERTLEDSFDALAVESVTIEAEEEQAKWTTRFEHLWRGASELALQCGERAATTRGCGLEQKRD